MENIILLALTGAVIGVIYRFLRVIDKKIVDEMDSQTDAVK